jgi:hypothetical protein
MHDVEEVHGARQVCCVDGAGRNLSIGGLPIDSPIFLDAR